MTWSNDGAYLAAGERGPNAEILVFEATTGRCIQALKGHKGGVGSVSFNADGKKALSPAVTPTPRPPSKTRPTDGFAEPFFNGACPRSPSCA